MDISKNLSNQSFKLTQLEDDEIYLYRKPTKIINIIPLNKVLGASSELNITNIDTQLPNASRKQIIAPFVQLESDSENSSDESTKTIDFAAHEHESCVPEPNDKTFPISISYQEFSPEQSTKNYHTTICSTNTLTYKRSNDEKSSSDIIELKSSDKTIGINSLDSVDPDFFENTPEDEWSCKQCTFINHSSIDKCEMCEEYKYPNKRTRLQSKLSDVKYSQPKQQPQPQPNFAIELSSPDSTGSCSIPLNTSNSSNTNTNGSTLSSNRLFGESCGSSKEKYHVETIIDSDFEDISSESEESSNSDSDFDNKFVDKSNLNKFNNSSKYLGSNNNSNNSSIRSSFPNFRFL